MFLVWCWSGGYFVFVICGVCSVDVFGWLWLCRECSGFCSVCCLFLCWLVYCFLFCCGCCVIIWC